MTARAPATRIEPRSPGPRWPFGDGHGDGHNGNGGEGFGRFASPETHRLGMWLALAAIAMMFIGLTSAYIVREGLDPNWRANRMPPLLLFNTAVLLVSSLTLEIGRRAYRRDGGHSIGALRGWLAATLLFGLTFLGGQIVAWRLLSVDGIYLSTNAHGSFFYLLTGLHGLHLVGGILALGYLFQALARQLTPAVRLRRWTEATALYWHFMGGLWVYLLLLLFAST